MKIINTTYAALILLLLLTVGASLHDFGNEALIISLAIAVAKAILVVTVFMEVRSDGPLSRLTLVFSVVWVMFFYILAATDFLHR